MKFGILFILTGISVGLIAADEPTVNGINIESLFAQLMNDPEIQKLFEETKKEIAAINANSQGAIPDERKLFEDTKREIAGIMSRTQTTTTTEEPKLPKHPHRGPIVVLGSHRLNKQKLQDGNPRRKFVLVPKKQFIMKQRVPRTKSVTTTVAPNEEYFYDYNNNNGDLIDDE